MSTHSIARQPASRDVDLDPDQLWYEAPWEGAARIRRVATCYRAINRSHHTTIRLDVLKQGGLTMIAVPVLVLGAGWLLLSFIFDPRRRSIDD